MGAKNSKSANITASPKKEALPVDGENHVNGDAKGDIIKDGNNVNHVIEVTEEVKELVKELAQEAANEVKEKEAAKAKEIQQIEEKENTTPVTTPVATPTNETPEEKSDKKKVQKKFSLRKKLSFLGGRREKKVKEDKHKNGDAVTSPEKKDEAAKEEETPKVTEEGQGDAPKAAAEEVKPEETNGHVQEETKEEVKTVVVEKVEEPVVEETKKTEETKTEVKSEMLAGITEALSKVELSSESFTSTTKEVSEIVVEKSFESKVETTIIANSVKEFATELISENGVDESHSEDAVAIPAQ